MTITDDLENLEVEEMGRLPDARLRDLKVSVPMNLAEMMVLDEWRRKQRDLPPRSVAIRRLMARAMKATP
jgi:hypothetical protein